MRKTMCLYVLLLALSLFSVLPISNSQEKPKSSDISFMPNVIPQTSVSFNNSRFVFDWLDNHFEVAMFTVGEDFEYELEVEGDKVKLKVKVGDVEFEEEVQGEVAVDKFMSNVTWGLLIPNVPEIISNYTDAFSFKVMNATFDVSQIELEMIDSFPDLGYNITRFHLPDNLVLSYEDLWLHNFTVLHPSMFEAKVEGVKGNPSWNLDPITFSGGIMIMTGYSEGAEGAYWDFWNASNVNGWNTANKTSSSENAQFDFGARLQIGNGSTASWFADENVQVTFNSTAVSANSQDLINIRTNAHFRLGKVEDVPVKASSSGVSMLALDARSNTRMVTGEDSTNADIELYSSTFSAPNAPPSADHIIYKTKNSAPIWHCLFYQVQLTLSSVDLYNVVISENYFGFGYGVTGTLDEIFLGDNYNAIYLYGSKGGTYKNVIARSNYRALYCYAITVDVYLINPDFDSWANIYWYSTSSAEVYRQYEFDLAIYFQNGSQAQNANVTISNDYLGTSDSWLTYANGSIPQQTYSYGHYNQTGASVLYDYNPYNLTVTLDGYEIYTDQINITQKEDLRIALTPSVPSVSENMEQYFLLGGTMTFLIMFAFGLVWRRKHLEKEAYS